MAPFCLQGEDPPLDDGTSSAAAMEVFNAPEAKDCLSAAKDNGERAREDAIQWTLFVLVESVPSHVWSFETCLPRLCARLCLFSSANGESSL